MDDFILIKHTSFFQESHDFLKYHMKNMNKLICYLINFHVVRVHQKVKVLSKNIVKTLITKLFDQVVSSFSNSGKTWSVTKMSN